MKNYFKTFIGAILAGVMIALAGTVYLSVKQDSVYLGALLFSFGLLLVVALDFKLYTGRIGYIIDHKPKYIIDILVIILGNIVGALIISLIVNLSQNQVIINEAIHLVDKKMSNDIFSILGLSILCGMMMYLAVEVYKSANNETLKVVGVIMGVMIFILSGFEHSIANIYYFLLANSWSLYMVLAFIVMIIGNAIGAILLHLMRKYIK